MKKNRLLWLPLTLITITPILSSCSNKNTYEVLYASLNSMKYIEKKSQDTPTYIKHEPDKSFETEKDLKQYLVANYKTNEELTNEVYRTFFLFFINTDWSKQRIYSSSTPNNEIKSIFALKDSKDVSISIRTAFAGLEDLKLDENIGLNFTFLLYGIFNITFLKDVGIFKTGDILQYIVDVCDTDEIIAKANIRTEANEYKLYFTYQYTRGNKDLPITQERWIKSHKISLWHVHNLDQWVNNYDANGVNGYIHWSFNKK
ncbi:MAG: hypothetical protein B1217_0470 [Candidatus Malacoplasma girerdii]|nr:MAG: hypothetical protein B1217_0470 [Candidatus Malacoplasma girerdii]